MIPATLVGQALPQFCPTTNHYYCGDGPDGIFLLVTIPCLDSVGTIAEITGFDLPVREAHIPKRADVFLADADAVPIDADGDESNDLTPLLSVDGCDDFTEALAAAGYELVT